MKPFKALLLFSLFVIVSLFTSCNDPSEEFVLNDSADRSVLNTHDSIFSRGTIEYRGVGNRPTPRNEKKSVQLCWIPGEEYRDVEEDYYKNRSNVIFQIGYDYIDNKRLVTRLPAESPFRGIGPYELSWKAVPSSLTTGTLTIYDKLSDLEWEVEYKVVNRANNFNTWANGNYVIELSYTKYNGISTPNPIGPFTASFVSVE